jgi:NAD dependent epimerase/dehydratase family enzyme
MKYFISGSAGIYGTDFCEVIEANSEVVAYDMGADICTSWCESHGLEFDPETEDYQE